MTIKDLISFAKAGWKPADVREFLQEIEPEPSADPEPDYKKLYEEEKKEREKLQKANTKKEQPEEPTTQEKLNDIMRSFM